MLNPTDFIHLIYTNDFDAISVLLARDDIMASCSYNNIINKAIENGNFKIFKALMLDDRISAEFYYNGSIEKASRSGNFEIVEFLFKDKHTENYAFEDSDAIELSVESGNEKITSFLWKNDILKESLKYDNIDLYNELKLKYIEDKIAMF
jgi:hypothetical protein